jgi:hypothetical protein
MTRTLRTRISSEQENPAPEGESSEVYNQLSEINDRLKSLTFLQKIWEWIKYLTPFITSSLFTRRNQLEKKIKAQSELLEGQEARSEALELSQEGQLPSTVVHSMSPAVTSDNLEKTALSDSVIIVQAPQHEGEGQVAQSNLALTGTVCAIL